MKYLNKVGKLSLATVLSSGIFATSVYADAEVPMHELEADNQVKIQVLEADSSILKNDVIERLKELFPGEFDHFQDRDFHMRQVVYPEDETVRYELDFHKENNGEPIFGYARFIGEDLQLEAFHYEPGKVEEATFPPKVTKAEAEKIAGDFLKEFSQDRTYELNEEDIRIRGNQTLLEPIRYTFSYIRTNENVPVSGHHAEVSVLGNGQVVQYYTFAPEEKDLSFEDVEGVQEEQTIQEKMKEHLSVDLEYQVSYDFWTGDRNVKLVYRPSNGASGVHAVSGHWQTADGFVENLPEEKEIEPITEIKLKPRADEVTIEEARAFAKEFLAIDSDKVKLIIESIYERETEFGRKIISIDYMYEYGHGGIGTNLEIDKQTGDIVQYHDIRSELMMELEGDAAKEENKISEEEALKKAVDYLKEYTPSILHEYAMPIRDPYFEKQLGMYHFVFPRVVDGIPVNGDEISVGIGADGTLQSLYVNYVEIENWPSATDVISEEEAIKKYKDALTLDLLYVQADREKENHYDLVYHPVFNGSAMSLLDANSGEWTKIHKDDTEDVTVTHPTAEEELNFLIAAGILTIDDGENFDADANITKGKAIETIMRSIRPFYDEFYPGMEEPKQSFENIGPDHPLYQIVEQAVAMGILDTESNTFDVDAALTKEQLAVWYIKGIGLEKAAELEEIYKVDFKDADKISEENIGYVALAGALGLLPAEDNEFRPEQEITYADLAISIFKFATLVE